jgi:SSS family solute:Na+ symporter
LGILITYLVLIILVSLLSHRKGFQNIFSTQKRLPWFFAGFSVFMFNPDTINVLSKMGIVATEGYSGMWIFYSGVLGAGFLPIIFAPLWSRLKFMTDNQFILLRFSGKSARILHIFRAIYVGYLVAALFIAQIFIGISKLLVVFFEVTYLQSYLIICGILAFIVVKNSLHLKVRTDLLNGIIYLLAFAIGGFYVIRQFGGFGEVYSKLNTHYEPFIRLIPENLDKTSFGSWPTLLVYFLVQWWSIQILDGAGPEAQRFMNTKNQYQAFKAAFLPLILFSLVFIFHSFVIDAGILMVHETSHLVPQIQGAPDLEAGFLTLYKISMPQGMSVLVFLAFLVAMISFLEAYINWGASFVVVDLFKTYIYKRKSDRFFSMLSYMVMLVIGITGIAIAWYNTHLLGLQKFIFSMAAGVGPVFVLRWFWWRVNAWSQLSAMLSSLILAVGWDFLYDHNRSFQSIVSASFETLNMSPYSFKLACITLLVSLIWLMVTFLTKPDDHGTLDAFVARVKPGGWWQGRKTDTLKFSTRKLVLLLIYPVISILPFLIIWQFKFGTPLIASALSVGWIALIIFTIRSMSKTNT